MSKSFLQRRLASTPNMARKDSAVSEHRSARSEMSSVAEMSALVREAAGNAKSSNWKDRVQAAARILDLPFGRAKRHYYGEARRVDAEEMDRAREAVAKLRAARHASNLNRSLAYLRAADPDMYGPAIDGIERSLAAAGVLDSAVAETTAADPVRPFGPRTPQPSDD